MTKLKIKSNRQKTKKLDRMLPFSIVIISSLYSFINIYYFDNKFYKISIHEHSDKLQLT